jgi:hypothetical protein
MWKYDTGITASAFDGDRSLAGQGFAADGERPAENFDVSRQDKCRCAYAMQASCVVRDRKSKENKGVAR